MSGDEGKVDSGTLMPHVVKQEKNWCQRKFLKSQIQGLPNFLPAV